MAMRSLVFLLSLCKLSQAITIVSNQSIVLEDTCKSPGRCYTGGCPTTAGHVVLGQWCFKKLKFELCCALVPGLHPKGFKQYLATDFDAWKVEYAKERDAAIAKATQEANHAAEIEALHARLAEKEKLAVLNDPDDRAGWTDHQFKTGSDYQAAQFEDLVKKALDDHFNLPPQPASISILTFDHGKRNWAHEPKSYDDAPIGSRKTALQIFMELWRAGNVPTNTRKKPTLTSPEEKVIDPIEIHEDFMENMVCIRGYADNWILPKSWDDYVVREMLRYFDANHGWSKRDDGGVPRKAVGTPSQIASDIWVRNYITYEWMNVGTGEVVKTQPFAVI